MEQLQHDSIRLAQTNAKLIDRLKNESNGFISNSFVDSLPNEATVKQNFEDYTNKIISHITRLQENDLNKEVELNNESHKIFILEQRIISILQGAFRQMIAFCTRRSFVIYLLIHVACFHPVIP